MDPQMDGDHTGMDGMMAAAADMPLPDTGMMSMAFHLGTSETVLFKFWKTTDAGSMVYSCVIVFVVGVLYEGLKYFREWVYKSWGASQKRCPENGRCHDKDEGSERPLIGNGGWATQMVSAMHCVQTILHAVQFFVSYLLMLVFMTYNVWLCLAVVLGATVGFFLFGWQKQGVANITEHCH